MTSLAEQAVPSRPQLRTSREGDVSVRQLEMKMSPWSPLPVTSSLLWSGACFCTQLCPAGQRQGRAELSREATLSSPGAEWRWGWGDAESWETGTWGKGYLF